MDGGWMETAVAAVASSAGLMGYAVRGRSAAVFGESAYRGRRDRPLLALTFDDGPSESTPAVLEVLAEHRVRATFFMCGQNVRRLPGIAREVVQRGHELGNHSDSHPRFDFKSPAFIHAELSSAQQTIQAATGVTPRWFRAPYGVRWFGLADAQKRLGLTGLMWTVLGRDWRWDAPRISRRLLRLVSNGAIICLHDGRRVQAAPDIWPTVHALQHVLPRLRDRGFEFLTVSDLLCHPN